MLTPVVPTTTARTERRYNVYIYDTRLITVKMCEILAKYLVEIVAGARGNIVSFVVGDVARWAETKMRPSRSVVFKVANMAEALLAAGYLEKIGKKYILRRDTPLWVKAQASDVEGLCGIIESALFNYTKVVK
jgi:hypothetical protein